MDWTSVALVLVLAVGSSGCSAGADRVLLPEDPCDLLTAEDVAQATDSEVTQTRRAASLDRNVDVQNRGGAEDDVPVPDRRLCVFTSTGPNGSSTVHVPSPSEDADEIFRSARDGRVESIADLGTEAYLSEGASLHVLIADSTFSVQVQDPGGAHAGPMLTRLAGVAVERLESEGNRAPAGSGGESVSSREWRSDLPR